MTDTFLLLTPLLMLAVVALLAFVGCSFHEGLAAGPTGLAATGCFGKVVLYWDAVGGATSYDLVRTDIGEANPIYSGASNTFTDTNVTPGTQYCYEVRYTASGGASGYSAQQCATPLPGQPFVTFSDQQPGLRPRNDFNDFLGMAITVGARPLSVVALGRWSGLGVNQTHAMHIFDVGANQVLNGSDVTADPNTSLACDGFLYTNLAAPVTLNAGSRYYILTKENLNGDNFYDDLYTDGVTPTVVTPTADATINSSVYFTGVFIPHAPGLTYGPVNFAYV